jgi:tryptophanyl-tRNA synthetase
MTMRILSGLQPSGRLHIGNYFGMMEAAIRLQDEGDAYYFIADYHSLTSIHDGKLLRSHVRDLATDFLACGLDPEKCVLFRQSDVPEHTELSWILSTVTPMGLLERCHSYKDKIANGIKPSHGLFAYPVLMAADILIYDSDVVPVGRDQKQHVEVTRDIAIKMNETFGDGLLKLPQPRIREDTAVVPGLDGQKMSKSYGNTIQLFEESAALKKKIMGITTDSTPVEAPKPTEGSSILALYNLVASPADYDAMVADYQRGGIGYGEFKKRLLAAITARFAPYRERREAIVADTGYVEKVLAAGAEKARAVARKTLARVRDAVGLG